MSKDYYKILGVERDATDYQLKSAYRKLSKKYHPDINKSNDAEEKFKEIASAYETLSDPNKKSNYDRFGSDGNPFGSSDHMAHGFSMEDIFENFGDIFGGAFGSRNANKKKGSDIRVRVVLNIQDIIKGVSKKIKYKRHINCSTCSGKGGTDVKNCLTCNGSGRRIVVQNTPFGQIKQETYCTDCHGSGKKVTNPCNSCHGEGTILKEEIIDIDIPIGVSSGMQLSMRGNGNNIRDGIAGDLYIFIEEEQNSSFKREGGNLIIEREISIIDSVLGANINVNTPHGDLLISIESGTEHGSTIRVSGKGIPDINLGLGDLYVIVKIKIPKTISDGDKKLLNKLAESENFKSL